MKHTTQKVLSFVLALAMVLSCFSGLTVKAQAAAIGDVAVTVNGDSVIIGNGYISREFSTAGDKLSTTEIVNHRADEVFTPAEGSEEFIIRITKEGDSAAPTVPALDRTGWTAIADSYHNASGPSDGPGSNLIDGNLDITATQVKLVATSSKNGQSFAGGAEFNLHTERVAAAANDREFAASALVLDGAPVVADTSAVINDVEKSGKMVTFHFKPYEFKGVSYTISSISSLKASV